MGKMYPYTVQVSGHIDYEFSRDETSREVGSCEIPAEFLPDLLTLLRQIQEKYPNLA